MGADKILSAFRNAEEEMKRVQEDAKTFFVKKAKTEDKKEKLSYNFTDREEKISLSDCEDQLREWAKELVDREIRRRPEGKMLSQLEDVKTKALDTVMESGTSEELIKALELCTRKIGVAWVVDTSQIKQISQ
jgi:fatty acid/phospholipid biosynthesis enzyme